MTSDDIHSNGSFIRTSKANVTVDSPYQKQIEERDKRIRELEEANEKWVSYNAEREVYVKKLQEEKSKNNTDPSNGLSQPSSTAKLEQIQKENKQLKSRVLELEIRLQQKEELESRLKNGCYDSPEVDLLKAQLTAYKEDFESERRDRERAQSQLADLEMELSIVKRELHQYNLREMQNLHQRRAAALEYHRQEYERTHPQSVYQSDGGRAVSDQEGEDEID